MATTKEIILATTIIVPATTLAARYIEKKPMPVGKIVLSSLGVGIGLSVIALAADDVAKAFAWLIIIGALLTNGATIANKISGANRVKGKP